MSGAALWAQQTESDRDAKVLPAAYLIDDGSNLELNDVLNLNSFKSVKNLSLKAGHTYWFQIDFKNEIETLETQEQWRLRTNSFNEAVL